MTLVTCGIDASRYKTHKAVKGPTFAYGKPGIPSKGTSGLP